MEITKATKLSIDNQNCVYNGRLRVCFIEFTLHQKEKKIPEGVDLTRVSSLVFADSITSNHLMPCGMYYIIIEK